MSIYLILCSLKKSSKGKTKHKDRYFYFFRIFTPSIDSLNVFDIQFNSTIKRRIHPWNVQFRCKYALYWISLILLNIASINITKILLLFGIRIIFKNTYKPFSHCYIFNVWKMSIQLRQTHGFPFWESLNLNIFSNDSNYSEKFWKLEE